MVKKNATDSSDSRRRRPATTPEGRENLCVSLAIDLVQSRLEDGTATSQETSHFLKLGSTREALEQERLRNENELLKAKVEQLAAAGDIRELYKEALSAMSDYQGRDEEEVEYYED